jgi:hypothetical protein
LQGPARQGYCGVPGFIKISTVSKMTQDKAKTETMSGKIIKYKVTPDFILSNFPDIKGKIQAAIDKGELAGSIYHNGTQGWWVVSVK